MYPTTRWSLVRLAGGKSPDRRHALEELCRIYRPAVLAYLRRVGHEREVAEDHAQSFFLRLVEQDLPARADPARGSFRSFLRVALRHHLSHLRDHDHALRRRAEGGHVDLDHALELPSTQSPERAFDAAFALAVIDQALARLRDDYASRGIPAHFDLLRPALLDGVEPGDLDALARELAIAPNAVSARLARLRRRLREAVRAEIAQTLENPEDVDAEMRQLRLLLDER